MAYRKGLVLSFGLVNVIVSIDGAVAKDDSLATVCCGPAGAEHVATQISQRRVCATCGEVAYADLKKARKVGNDFQVIEQQEVASVRDAALGATKRMMTLTVHNAAEVDSSTLQGESVYYVSPDGAAQIGAYSLLLDAVSRHPEYAFLTQYTPTSRASMWQLKAFNGTLVISQRTWPENVKSAPDTHAVDPDPVLQGQLDQVIASMVKPFDVNDYRDTYREALAAAVAAKELVAGVSVERTKSDAPAAAPVVDLSAALTQMLGNAKPAKKGRASA